MTKPLAASLAEMNEALKPGYSPALLQRQEALFQFLFDEGEPFHLHANQQGFVFHPGEAPRPTMRLYLPDHACCWRLLTGKANGMEAFMSGAYRADGNIVLSQILLHLFRSAGTAFAYQVQG